MSEQPDVTKPSGPPCSLCGGPAVVHWQRRLTDDEFAAYLALEQARRDEATSLADPELPPDFGPMPVPDDCTRPVYGCMNHAIGLDAASLVHAKTCTAPNPKTLPHCDCLPEPTPPPEPDPDPVQLPPGWING